MIYVNDHIEFGAWSWSIPKNMVTFSPSWFDSLGYEVPQNLNQNLDTWKKLIHPKDLNKVMQTLRLHLDGKTYFYQCVNKLLTKSGEYRENLDVGIVIVRNSFGDPLTMVGVDIDLSKTRFCQADIENSESVYIQKKLTKKEVEICECIKKGYSRNEIGKILNISPNTVKNHEQNIFKKFEVESRAKLICKLFKNDLVEIKIP